MGIVMVIANKEDIVNAGRKARSFPPGVEPVKIGKLKLAHTVK